jgi:uncharacterized protein
VNIKIETSVNPTEDIEKVRKALSTITTDQNFKEERVGDVIILRLESSCKESLAKFYSMLREDMILDSSRRALFSRMRGNKINFCLNKQVAFAGHISFCQPKAESPLGPITVEIENRESESLIDWLAPNSPKSR